MIKSQFAQVVGEKDFEFLVSSYDPTEGVKVFDYFPTKKINSLQWKSGTNGREDNQAAPVIARNTSLPFGEMPTTTIIRGDLPKIGVKYDMKDDELTEFQNAMALAGSDAAAAQIARETLDSHIDKVIKWVNNRVTWIALQSMSRGKVVFTQANNGTIVSDQDMDYNVRKHGRWGAAWTSPSTAKPITTDLVNAVKDGRSQGLKYQRVWMSAKTFADFAATEEVIKMSASLATNLLGAAYLPDVDTVNGVLKKRTDLNGLQINIIDELMNVDGENKNPFIDNVILFTEGDTLGQSFWCTPADMGVKSSTSLKSLNNYICVKQWATEDPLVEYTGGIANILPAFEASQKALLVDTINDSWNEGAA